MLYMDSPFCMCEWLHIVEGVQREWGHLKWLSYYLFTTTYAKHQSQDRGSGVVNMVSSQVNDIRPLEIKVHHPCRDIHTHSEEDRL